MRDLPRLLSEFSGAICLLTRLPLGRHGAAATASGAWAWPLVGALVGAVGAVVLALLAGWHVPPLLAAPWALAAMLLLTGALHEDGLADLADGLGGGTTPERRLAIMRDSRIGSYGGLALVLSTAMRLAALVLLARPGLALVVAGGLARAAMIVPVLALPPARSGGLATTLGVPDRWAGLAGGLLALVIAAMLLPHAALAATLVAALAGGAVAAVARRALGGVTGDVFGATAVLAECAVLTILVATGG
jgi:adenosylcobinamide-GDP ribazoletransferase